VNNSGEVAVNNGGEIGGVNIIEDNDF